MDAPVSSSAVSDHLPKEVVTCLENARFLHLATCTNNTPHVSLMNYTYLPSHPFPSSSLLPSGPTIIMTSNPDSKKTTNLVTNPAVSLLVHEWVSSRPATGAANSRARERSPAAGPRSSLAAMLMDMNSAEVSSISATINGEAIVLPAGAEEARWCKEQHLANNTFADEEKGGGGPVALGRRTSGVLGGIQLSGREEAGDGGREKYIEDGGVRVVVVRIKDGRVSDWKGGVKDFVLASGEGQAHGQVEGRVNGVV